MDSGASHALAPEQGFFDQLEFAAPPVPAVITVGAGGKQAVFRAGRLSQDVRFGDATIRKPVVHATTGGTKAGVKLLREFELTYDFSARRVRLRRSDAAPITMPPHRLIGVAFRANRRPWEVWELMPYSKAAAAGLAVGHHGS